MFFCLDTKKNPRLTDASRAGKSSSTDDNTAHPCTRLDWAFVVSFSQQLSLDAYIPSTYIIRGCLIV